METLFIETLNRNEAKFRKCCHETNQHEKNVVQKTYNEWFRRFGIVNWAEAGNKKKIGSIFWGRDWSRAGYASNSTTANTLPDGFLKVVTPLQSATYVLMESKSYQVTGLNFHNPYDLAIPLIQALFYHYANRVFNEVQPDLYNINSEKTTVIIIVTGVLLKYLERTDINWKGVRPSDAATAYPEVVKELAQDLSNGSIPFKCMDVDFEFRFEDFLNVIYDYVDNGKIRPREAMNLTSTNILSGITDFTTLCVKNYGELNRKELFNLFRGFVLNTLTSVELEKIDQDGVKKFNALWKLKDEYINEIDFDLIDPDHRNGFFTANLQVGTIGYFDVDKSKRFPITIIDNDSVECDCKMWGDRKNNSWRDLVKYVYGKLGVEYDTQEMRTPKGCIRFNEKTLKSNLDPITKIQFDIKRQLTELINKKNAKPKEEMTNMNNFNDLIDAAFSMTVAGEGDPAVRSKKALNIVALANYNGMKIRFNSSIVMPESTKNAGENPSNDKNKKNKKNSMSWLDKGCPKGTVLGGWLGEKYGICEVVDERAHKGGLRFIEVNGVSNFNENPEYMKYMGCNSFGRLGVLMTGKPATKVDSIYLVRKLENGKWEKTESMAAHIKNLGN